MPSISTVTARPILDSRALPAIEAEVTLTDGSRGRACVAGGLTSSPYAAELPVAEAVRRVNDTIGPALRGFPGHRPRAVDELLVRLDGTPDRSVLGANAMLATSCAAARAAARSTGTPLYRSLAPDGEHRLPMPLMNLLSGRGPVREFMLVPHGASSFRQALTWGADVHHALRRLLEPRGHTLTLTDEEGAFTPPDAGFELLLAGIDAAGLVPGRDVGIAIDLATPLPVDRCAAWLASYPLVSLEDPLGPDDWTGWTRLTAVHGAGLHLTGDSLFAGQATRLREGITRGAANGILVKPGQIGTLTESLDLMHLARNHGYHRTVSHRTGETTDPLIADLAVAAGTMLKSGAPVHGERTAKYNRLLRIEEDLGPAAWSPC